MTRWRLPTQRQSRQVVQKSTQAASLVALRDVFTPTRPRRDGSGFVGRQAELRRMMDVIEDERAHIVLYAGRGLGKTSLANTLTTMLRTAGYCVGRHTCDSTSDYESIMLGLVRDVPSSFLVVPLTHVPNAQGAEQALPQGAFGPGDVACIPTRLSAAHIIFIIDEFDRVGSEKAHDRLADTIKQVSDRGTNLSFIIIGAASELEQLVGRYPSIGRSLVGVHLPPLTDDETSLIIDGAATASGYVFPSAIKANIVSMAAGSPYLAHLFGLRTSQAARARGANEIAECDLVCAIRRVSGEANSEVLSDRAEQILAMAVSVPQRQRSSLTAPQVAK